MMRGNLVNLACDAYGSHVVQKAIDLIDEFDVVVIAECVRPRVRWKVTLPGLKRLNASVAQSVRLSRHAKTMSK